MITARITVYTVNPENRISDVRDMTESQFRFLSDVIQGLNLDHMDVGDPFIGMKVLSREESE